tara:strand:- start:686 stop:976 length:291 start_codon:yes stop_codon:yes gene_type:complete
MSVEALMAIEVGTAIFVNVDVFHHSSGQVATVRPDRRWSVHAQIKKGDIGLVVDIVRDMQPGRWAETAEIFFQKAGKKVPIMVKELNNVEIFSVMG